MSEETKLKARYDKYVQSVVAAKTAKEQMWAEMGPLEEQIKQIKLRHQGKVVLLENLADTDRESLEDAIMFAYDRGEFGGKQRLAIGNGYVQVNKPKQRARIDNLYDFAQDPSFLDMVVVSPREDMILAIGKGRKIAGVVFYEDDPKIVISARE